MQEFLKRVSVNSWGVLTRRRSGAVLTEPFGTAPRWVEVLEALVGFFIGIDSEEVVEEAELLSIGI
jgi:hypothetical protein